MASMTAAARQTDQPPPGPASWPLHAALELGPLPTAPGCARDWTGQILREWQLAPLTSTAQLIVSELLTNAMVASRSLDSQPAIWLSLHSDRHQLVVLVRDFCPAAPEPRHAAGDDESGRGLMLVQALSDRSGWHRPADGTPGKVVWALVLRAGSRLPGQV